MAGKKIDFEALLKLPTCGVCGKPILGKMLKCLGKAFHDTCFTCANCRKSLASGYQMDETRKPGEPELPQHKPHCPECYASLFMPKCKACGKNIADQAYVQACKAAWHEACFVCTKCRKPLGQAEKHWPVDEKPYCEKDYWEAKIQSQAKRVVQQPKSFVQSPMTGKSMVGKSMVGKSMAGKSGKQQSMLKSSLKHKQW